MCIFEKLINLKPREEFVYYTGVLQSALMLGNNEAFSAKLDAQRAYDLGHVTLTQRRLDGHTTEYVACGRERTIHHIPCPPGKLPPDAENLNFYRQSADD